MQGLHPTFQLNFSASHPKRYLADPNSSSQPIHNLVYSATLMLKDF